MKKTIYFWSPHLTNVGTAGSTLHSAVAFSKFSQDKYDIKMLDVFGEWEEHRDTLKKSNIEKINLTFNYKKLLPKYGFIFSRFSYILIILISFIPLILLLIKRKFDYFITHLLTSLPLFLLRILKVQSKIILRISGKPKFNFFRTLLWKSLKDTIFKVTCPTQELVFDLNKDKNFKNDKNFYLPDPVIDIKEYLVKKMKPKSYRFDKEAFFLYVGRFTKQKKLYLSN